MNIENRAVKILLKHSAPLEVYQKLEEYRIPSPYKEILIVSCIEGKDYFQALDLLAERYNIHLSYWTYCRRLKRALEMYRQSAKTLPKQS